MKEQRRRFGVYANDISETVNKGEISFPGVDLDVITARFPIVVTGVKSNLLGVGRDLEEVSGCPSTSIAFISGIAPRIDSGLQLSQLKVIFEGAPKVFILVSKFPNRYFLTSPYVGRSDSVAGSDRQPLGTDGCSGILFALVSAPVALS